MPSEVINTVRNPIVPKGGTPGIETGIETAGSMGEGSGVDHRGKTPRPGISVHVPHIIGSFVPSSKSMVRALSV